MESKITKKSWAKWEASKTSNLVLLVLALFKPTEKKEKEIETTCNPLQNIMSVN